MVALRKQAAINDDAYKVNGSRLLLKELEQLIILPSTKSANADTFYKKVPRYPDKKVPSTNYPYFAKSF